jgi:hypothetical protein
MALTIGTLYEFDGAASSPQQPVLGTKLVFSQITFDSAYATGGLALSASDFGLDEILAVFPANDAGYLFEYDKANGKLLAYYIDNDAVADSAAIQVAASVDLSAINPFVIAVGR